MPVTEGAPGQLLGPTLGISMSTWNRAWTEAFTSDSEIVIDGFATPAVDVTDLRFQADPAHAPDKMSLWAEIPVEHDGWVRAHNAVRHELSQFQKALSAIGMDQPLCGWQVYAIKSYIAGHLVHVHEHNKNEDDVFNPALRKRVVYPDKLEADHVQLVALMDQIEALAKSLNIGDTVGPLTDLWSRYTALMLPHLHEEEVVGLPLARAYFSPKEIGKIVESFMKEGDPVSMGGFVHAMGSKQVALGFMAEAGIPTFVWYLPKVGFKALRTLYRKKMQSHVDSLMAGRVVSSVHKPRVKTAGAEQQPTDENSFAQQPSSPSKVHMADVQVLGARVGH